MMEWNKIPEEPEIMNRISQVRKCCMSTSQQASCYIGYKRQRQRVTKGALIDERVNSSWL